MKSPNQELKRSFYTLEMFVEPGGARMSFRFVLTEWERVRQVLASYLTAQSEDPEPGLELLLDYGTALVLQTYQAGVRTQRLDLRPFVSVRIQGYEPFALSAWDGMTAFQVENSPARLAKPDDFEECLEQLTAAGPLVWTALLNWAGIEAEALTGNLLRPGERVKLFASYENREVRGEYGAYESEQDFFKAQPAWHNLSALEQWTDEQGWDALDEALVAQRQQAAEAEASHKKQRELAYLDEFNALLKLAEQQSEQEQFAAAIGTLDEAFALARPEGVLVLVDRDVIHNNHAYYYYRLGQPETALRELDELLADRPVCALAHHTRAEVLVALGRYPEALASIERAIKLHKSSKAMQAYRREILQLLK